MESNNYNRISATGLKSLEIDEIKTDKIIIDNTVIAQINFSCLTIQLCRVERKADAFSPFIPSSKLRL